jgi:ABC-type glycerol-3-phosphate transport system permease component
VTTTRFLPFWKRAGITLIVVLGALFFVLPLWWAIVWATWHTSEIFSFPPKLLPGPYLLDNLTRLEARLGIGRAFFNSAVTTSVSLVGALFFCSLAGFAFAKYNFALKNLFFYILLATMAVPGQITAIPLFAMMVRIGWIDSYQGIIIPGLVPAFGVFMMRMGAEQAVSDEILEAARMDGANELRVFFQVALPALMPQVAALAIFRFSGTWGSFFWPLIVLRSTKMFTLPVALSSIFGAYESPYDLLLAGSLLSLIPPMALFFATQRFFLKSLIAGAFK